MFYVWEECYYYYYIYIFLFCIIIVFYIFNKCNKNNFFKYDQKKVWFFQDYGLSIYQYLIIRGFVNF